MFFLNYNWAKKLNPEHNDYEKTKNVYKPVK